MLGHPCRRVRSTALRRGASAGLPRPVTRVRIRPRRDRTATRGSAPRRIDAKPPPGRLLASHAPGARRRARARRQSSASSGRASVPRAVDPRRRDPGPGADGSIGARHRAAPDAPFLAGLPGRADDPRAGVVHAPGRPLAARVPGHPGRRAASSTPSRKPELAAEITLQPVRRYGVDAAILYSDIVVPVAAIGFGVDVAPGTGPVVERPVPLARPTSTASARSSPRPTRPTCSRRCASWPSELDVPADRLRRRAVHRGQLPGRGRPVAHATPRTKALMYGDEALWHAPARPPGRPGHRLAALPGRRPAPRPSSCSTRGPARSARPTTSASCCPTAAKVLAGWPTSACPASTSASTPASCSALHGRGRRRRGRASTGGSPLDRRPAPAPAGTGAAGQPRPGRLPVPAGTSSRPRRREVLAAQRRPARPRLQPRPRRAARDRPRPSSSRSSTWCTTRPVRRAVDAGVTTRRSACS